MTGGEDKEGHVVTFKTFKRTRRIILGSENKEGGISNQFKKHPFCIFVCLLLMR